MAIRVLPLCFILFLSGCVRGILYSSVTDPLDIDMHNTRRSDESAMGGSYKVQEPLTSLRISSEWSSRGMADIATHFNFRRIYYADIETFSILMGIYENKNVIVYGEREGA